MKIKDLPWFNRPGFKLTRKGVDFLDDAELLAIIFGKGSKKESAIEISNRLLKKYNLNKLEDLSVKELAKECNWDFNKALQILSLIELSKRYNKLINKGYKNKISDAKDVYNLLKDELGCKKKEYFICLYLNTQNKIIKKEVISIGTLNSSLIHPREVFKTAIKESANSVILVHNHPSGDHNPSNEDLIITRKIVESGKILSIEVYDHLIIGKEKYYSFRENLMLN